MEIYKSPGSTAKGQLRGATWYRKEFPAKYYFSKKREWICQFWYFCTSYQVEHNTYMNAI